MKEKLASVKKVKSALKQVGGGVPVPLYEASNNQIFDVSLKLQDQLKEKDPAQYFDYISEKAAHDADKVRKKAGGMVEKVNQILEENQDKISGLEKNEKENLGLVLADVLKAQKRAKAGLLSYFVRKGLINYQDHLKPDGSLNTSKINVREAEYFGVSGNMLNKLQYLEGYSLSESKLRKIKKQKIAAQTVIDSKIDESPDYSGGNTETARQDDFFPEEQDEDNSNRFKNSEIVIYRFPEGGSDDQDDESEDGRENKKNGKIKHVKGVLLDSNGEEVFESDRKEVVSERRKSRAVMAGLVASALIGAATGASLLYNEIRGNFPFINNNTSNGESRDVGSLVPPPDVPIVINQKTTSSRTPK